MQTKITLGHGLGEQARNPRVATLDGTGPIETVRQCSGSPKEHIRITGARDGTRANIRSRSRFGISESTATVAAISRLSMSWEWDDAAAVTPKM
jgi:hypothetical protein